MSKFHFSSLKFFIDAEVPTGSNILLVGPPGVGKTVFSESLICECLHNMDKAMYVTLDHAPRDVKKRVLMQGIDLEKEDSKLVFVDGYSWLIGDSTEKFYVRNLSNLSDLSVKMNSADSAIGNESFFIFDSISTLLVYGTEDEVARFIEVNMARMKNVNNVGVWVVEQGIHTEKFYNTLRHIVDGILEMRFEENEDIFRYIRMHTFKGLAHRTKWLQFVINQDRTVSILSYEDVNKGVMPLYPNRIA